MSTLSSGYYAEQDEFTGTTVVEISVPSGKLIAADSLRRIEHFNIDAPLSMNSGAGLDAWAQVVAKQSNTAYAFVGNSCPTVTRQPDGSLEVISPAFNEETDEPVFHKGESPVAEICTDLWATMLTDYQNWLDHNGPDISIANQPFGTDVYTVIDVAAGKYRWTVYSHSDDFDMHAEGRVTYARLECIEKY